MVLEAGEHRLMVDGNLARRLSAHQMQGLQWLFKATHGLNREGWQGGILADGMGMGKTLQVLALVHSLVHAGTIASVLVVVPASLVKNWQQEAAKFVMEPHVQSSLPVTFVGDDAQCSHARTALNALAAAHPDAPRVVVFSYAQLRLHGAAFTASGGRLDLLFADEAHALKGEATATTRAVAALVATGRILITATPAQNDLDELFTLADLAVPGAWGTSSGFASTVSQPLHAAVAAGASAPPVTLVDAALARARLAQLKHPMILSRSLTDLFDGVPKPHVYTLLLEPSELQRAIYLALGADEGNSVGRLQLLHQLCIHPILLEPHRHHNREVACVLPSAWPTSSRQLLLRAPITAAAVALIEGALSADDKVVVVSQYVKALYLVGSYISEVWGGDACVRIVGGQHDVAHKKARDAFNHRRSAAKVLLLSLDLAAGHTLTGGNHMIFLDGHWNYKRNEQALGRLYRPGQPKPTHHHRLGLAGSIADSILVRQLQKQSLSIEVKSSLTRQLNSMAPDERRSLFTLDSSSSVPRLMHALTNDDGRLTKSTMFGALQFVRAGEELPVCCDLAWLPLRVVCSVTEQTGGDVEMDIAEEEAERERIEVDRTSVCTVPLVDVSRMVRFALHAEDMVWVA